MLKDNIGPLLRGIVDKPLSLVKGFLPYRPNEVNVEIWNKNYSDGGWDYIRQIDDLGRYSLIAGYTQYVKQAGKILDVGCGEGILQERLDESKYSRYLGIDISSVAIEKANENRTDKTTFLESGIESFNTEERFDVIIFNECLYYLQDPLGILEKYELFLREKGVFIISMYISDNTKKLWRMIERRYVPEDEMKVTNKMGDEWIVKLIIRQKDCD